jgi:hypothetical protein
MLVAPGLPGAQPAVNALLAKGYVVAATDFPQHGERTWCKVSSDCGTGPLGSGADGTCTPFAEGVGPTYQGDTDGPGCDAAPVNPGTCTTGTPNLARSGQTFISANFFRTRDALRQNLIDQAALALALARPAFAPTVAATLFTARLAADGIAISTDPNAVYWEGISLGGIAGTEVLATNPRFSRGVTAVAGGTLFDLFTDSPSFQSRVTPLFSCLLKPQLDAIGAGGFDRAFIDPSNATSFAPTVAAAYGKTAITAKWILDPGDPLNYARHLKTVPLPNIVLGTAGTAKSVLGIVATNDAVIRNPYNLELFTNGAVDTITYVSNGGLYLNPSNLMHGILGFDATVQADAANYLADPAATLPVSPVTLAQ